MKIIALSLAAHGLTAAPVSAQDKSRAAPPDMQALAPALADYTDTLLFGDVWKRTGLSFRDRSLITVSALIAGGRIARRQNATIMLSEPGVHSSYSAFSNNLPRFESRPN
jgi:4-carboxymuconolactone decarboxylase